MFAELATAGVYAGQTGSLIGARIARYPVNMPVVRCIVDECPNPWLGRIEAVFVGALDPHALSAHDEPVEDEVLLRVSLRWRLLPVMHRDEASTWRTSADCALRRLSVGTVMWML